MRALGALMALGVAAFCTFGFLATFEPLNEGEAIKWRIGYAFGFLASASLLLVLLRRSLKQ